MVNSFPEIVALGPVKSIVSKIVFPGLLICNTLVAPLTPSMMSSSKVMVRLASLATFNASSAGTSSTTTGGSVSGGASVVKFQLVASVQPGAMFPDSSSTMLTIRIKYSVL